MKATLIAVAAAFVVNVAQAECAYPKAPQSSPNGSTATEAEMVAGMNAIKTYNEEMTKYLSCLDEEANQRILEAGGDQERIKNIKAVTTRRHDAAVDELNAKANEFNDQVRAFKQKQKG
jgi:hypothetical protein